MHIERVTAPVRRQVEDAIRQEILEGDLLSGQRLVERELCERLGVSRPLIREALRQLQAEKLVTSEPHGGMRVASVDIEEARQLYDVRSLLEPFAASRFVENATDEQRDLLAEVAGQIEEAIRADQCALAIKRKNEFYRILVAGCGHPVLEQTVRGLQNRIQLLRGISMSEPGRLEHTAGEIQMIADAIAMGGAREARKACEEHLEQARATTLAALSRRQDEDTGLAIADE
ncbi:DNA-binding GntR family transcriptional regulator [Natronocella acetinitrilica]|uniref:DNA-binding GntR family transcriptional regulator n=1 Tax=Natronocella acetinitrilica TaxID=414046 RepID=A0AAE3KDJ9_9GAMM|nr:GntR family transcriptional regulator [Natronocella acetinitrilica]MCP1676398.1 DNA-binding GntR family transcriptional regulator [Natronocella acetinitrilica]